MSHTRESLEKLDLRTALNVNLRASYAAGRTLAESRPIVQRSDGISYYDSSSFFGDKCQAIVSDSWTRGYPSIGHTYIQISTPEHHELTTVWGMNYTTKFTLNPHVTHKTVIEFLARVLKDASELPSTTKQQPIQPPLRGIDGYERCVLPVHTASYFLQYAIAFEGDTRLFGNFSFKETISLICVDATGHNQPLGIIYATHAKGHYLNTEPTVLA